MVPGRTKNQCNNRWHSALNPSIDRENGSTGKWTENEDIALLDAVQMHGGKDWVAISALVPGRTKIQCCHRWKDALDLSTDRANERTGKWTEVEDGKLKDGVQTNGGKNWDATAALVPGRTAKQCRSRWHKVLLPASTGRTNVRVNGQKTKTAS
jgi:hypothetical protein